MEVGVGTNVCTLTYRLPRGQPFSTFALDTNKQVTPKCPYKLKIGIFFGSGIFAFPQRGKSMTLVLFYVLECVDIMNVM
jgi:hypothetical protein